MNKVRLEKQTNIGKTEKTRFWEIETDGSEVFSSYGFTDSDESKVKSNSYSTIAKNVGHINETTADEQAEKEAMSLVNKKLRAGYSVVEGQEAIDLYQETVAERQALIKQAKIDKIEAEAKAKASTSQKTA